MSKPKLSLSLEEKTEWNAADTILDKRESEFERVWKECNIRGITALKEVVDYLEQLEGQNHRLNRRIDALENQMRFLDRLERLLEMHEKAKP